PEPPLRRHCLRGGSGTAPDEPSCSRVTRGLGTKNIRFIEGLGARLDLKQEVIPAPSVFVQVKETALIHPHWDAAILRVEGLPQGIQPLRLAGRAPDALDGRLTVVIGYPALDSRNDISLQQQIFRHV